jgi:acetyl esterase/lipase
MAHRKSWLAREPLKSVYTFYSIVGAVARLSFLSIYYIPHKLRPNRSWTWKIALDSEVTRLTVVYATKVHLRIPMSLEPGNEGDRFVKISPKAEHKAIYSGILHNNNNIKPETLGGTWYPHCYSSKDINNKVVLHFHGGAWVLLDSREGWCGHGLRTLSEQFDGAPVFCPEYRLATLSTGKWPAPLQDALTSYLYLLYELKIDPSRIILSGDSVGATLVLALIRYIISSQSRAVNALPLPIAALLWSPWVSGYDTDNEANKGRNNKSFDTIDPSFLKWGLQELTDNETIISSSDPYLKPLEAPFKTGSVPLWIQVSTAEMFYNAVRRFAQKMRAVGNTVNVYEIPDATHDPLISWRLGFQEELKEGMRQAWEMVKSENNG